MFNRPPVVGCHLLRASLLAVFFGGLAAHPAHADIYTWVDAAGRINISNLVPPEGVDVTNVVHESAPKAVARPDPGSDAARPSEIQVLSERVRQLESELSFAQNQVPQVPLLPQYQVMAPPPVVQYFIDVAAPAAESYAGAQPGCDPAWSGCAAWWPGGYPVSVVFLRPNFRRLPPHAGHNLGGQPQVPGPMKVRRG